MGYNEDLQGNNAELQAILEAVEALPDAADYVIGPETGTVGQALVVKELDENGRPAKWETVDFPEGGGLPNPDELIPGQPLVPYHTTEDGIPGGWTQEAFIPANVAGAAGQSVRWTGEVDDNGNPVWEGYTPVVPPTYPELGQTIVVSAVDEWGNPTEWEAKDLPTGGGVTGDVVRPKDLQEYTPKHYLKTLGMLSKQDGSVLPSISGEWAAVAYGDGVTVLVASGTNIAARKVDGKLWEAVTLPRSGDWGSVVYSKPHNAFIAVDNNGYWALSFDMGATWVDGEEETGSPWVSAGTWRAFSADTTCVFQELTGTIWPPVFYLDATTDIYYGVASTQTFASGILAYMAGKFVQATGNQIGFATDIRYGEWEWVDLPEGVVIDEIAYTEGMFMGYSNGNGIYYSEDGVSWLVHDSFPNSAIIYPNGMTISGEIESVVACNGRFLFFVPGAQYYVLSVPANDVYGWDFLTWGLPDVWQRFDAVGDRFIAFMCLDEETTGDVGNWSADVPFVLYSDDGLTLTPTVPKLIAPSGGGGSYSDWSDEDKAAVLNDVIAKLPVYNGEVEDV